MLIFVNYAIQKGYKITMEVRVCGYGDVAYSICTVDWHGGYECL